MPKKTVRPKAEGKIEAKPAPAAVTEPKAERKPVPAVVPEAVPTFPTYQKKIEEKDRELRREVDNFLGLLRVLGTPMIDDSQAHFIYHNPFAHEVKLGGEFPA